MTIPARVSLRLELACLQRIADSSGARVLHVKGEALHPVLMVGRGPSSDCDVLVHPDDLRRFVTELEQSGWELRTTFRHGSIFEHAATYYHPSWGTVDVHRHFPGLDANPTLTFQEFWASRDIVSIGGVAVNIPSLLSQRVILLAHAARDAMGRSELDRRNAWDLADEITRQKIDELAARLGGRVPTHIATGRADAVAGERGFRVWSAMYANADPTEIWHARIRDAEPGLPTLKLLLEATRPNPDHLAIRLGHKPSTAEMRREWWQRWLRGGRRLWRLARRDLRV